MALSLRAILLLLAVILFMVAAIGEASEDLVTWGLAVFAAAFLLDAAGMDRRFGKPRA